MFALGVGIVVVLVTVIGLIIRRDLNWIRKLEETPCTPSRHPLTQPPSRTEYISKRYAWFGLKHKDKIDIDSF